MAKIRIVKPGYQAAKLKIFKRSSPPQTKARTRQFSSKRRNKSALTNVHPLITSKSDLEREKAKEANHQASEIFIFPLSPTPVSKPSTVENQKEKHRIKKQEHQQTRSKEEQKRINAEVLLIVQKTQESIHALRNGMPSSTHSKRQCSASDSAGNRQAGKTIDVEVSITNPGGVRKTQFTIEQSGSKEEEKIGMQPIKRQTIKNHAVLVQLL